MTNLAEILNNAPQGLKLYSLVHGEVTLKKVDTTEKYYHIETIDKQCDNFNSFTKDGKLYYDYDGAECVLFPSKKHKSWDNWQEVLFQKGDVVTCTKDINQKDKTFIITKIDGNFIALNNNKNLSHNNTSLLYRYATPKEREKFFKELNANGYTWNIDAGIKEKPFSINELKPFDKVLMRNEGEYWRIEIFQSYFKGGGDYIVYSGITHQKHQCIPYNDETKHLLGTTNNCPNKYKTW